jgi:hypothetical protein
VIIFFEFHVIPHRFTVIQLSPETLMAGGYRVFRNYLAWADREKIGPQNEVYLIRLILSSPRLFARIRPIAIAEHTIQKVLFDLAEEIKVRRSQIR